MSKYLTLTVVVEGENLNYGEGFANISTLKKYARQGGSYSYASRQSIRYSLVELMHNDLNMSKIEGDAIGLDGKVVQFAKDASIKDYPEIDLFGYMKTGTNADSKKGQDIRKAVRLSDAIALERFNGDTEFGNNMGLARRKENTDNGLFQQEIHRSFYTYTLTIELDRIGRIDGETDLKIDPAERTSRIAMLLDAVKLLYRDIKGRRANLTPHVAIGGLYESGNPLFYNMLKLKNYTANEGWYMECCQDIHLTINGNAIKESTSLGLSGLIKLQIKDGQSFGIQPQSIEEFFTDLKTKVKTYYEAK